MTKKIIWHTEKRKVNDLLPYSKNPRSISDAQMNNLKKSLEKFNIVEIPAVDTDGKIIAGHQRVRALQLLNRGDEQIEVRVPNRKLSKKEYEQYLIISNKVTGSWDEAILSEHFEADLLLESGFDQEEITDLFSDILDTEDDGFDAEEELKKIKKPESKDGDLYQLGPHRLLCGDSTDPEVVKKVVGDEKIHMIYNDPVYNIGLSYDSGIGGTKQYGGTAKDSRKDEEYEDFLTKTVQNTISVTQEDVHVFYYCDETYVPMIARIYGNLGIDFKRICIWLKGVANPTPQVAFSKVYEPCVYGTIGRPYLSPNHKNFDEVLNKDTGTGNELIKNMMDMYDVWAVSKLNGNQYEHPTQKPITLHDKPIRRCTKIGGNILSLFGGSGGELLAAHQLKRNCFMVEMDPIFVDLIIKRYESFTGERAAKI